MRLQLTKKTDQALRAVLVLSEAAARMKGTELAARVGTSAGWLPQVLQPLLARGWVSSTTGPTGGYLLDVSLGRVNLLALIEAVEGPTDTGRCVLEDRTCGSTLPCALHEPWLRARASLMRELDSTPLTDLALPSASSPNDTGSNGKGRQ